MYFISLEFLAVFLPTAFLLYFLSRKYRLVQNIILLAASLLFYGCYDIKYLIFLAVSIITVYVCGLICLRCRTEKWKNGVCAAGVLINLLMLLGFKYTGFFLGSLRRFGIDISLPEILLPVGLSFYVFQNSTYLMDLQRGRIDPEKNIVTVALFVSFFPTITSGPIQRSTNLIPQIKGERKITAEGIQRAVITFLWGAFLKMVIADRLALFTRAVWSDLDAYSGLVLVICALAYSIQIYTDFIGYSYMAIAVAGLFGFYIPENFHQPYLATNIADFWRRWHISLTTWFTDYLYIPLGGNRKGTVRRYLNVLIVFLVSGLWHGAAWSFVIWGGIHAVYQIVGKMTLQYREKLCAFLGINRKSVAYRIWQSLIIFCLTSFAWIFFRAESFSQAMEFIQRMLGQWNPWVLFDQTLLSIGLSGIEWNISIVSVAVLLMVSCVRERGYHSDAVVRQGFPVTMAVILLLLVSVAVYGMYGEGYSASDFIYAGF